MLPVLRNEQLRFIEGFRRDDFRRGLVAILDRRCPGWQRDDGDASNSRLAQAMAAARARGILGQRATAKYMIFSMAMDGRFDTWLSRHWDTPEVRAGSVTPDARMEMLADELLQADDLEELFRAE
jgi:hypothetical protein